MDAKPMSDEELAEVCTETRICMEEPLAFSTGPMVVARLLATIDSLRAEAAANVKTALDACDEEQAVRVERDRYKAALERIAASPWPSQSVGYGGILSDVLDTARAALEDK